MIQFFVAFAPENDAPQEEQAKVDDIVRRWTNINKLLSERKAMIDVLLERKQLMADLAGLDLILDGYNKWFENTKVVFRVLNTIFPIKSYVLNF